MPIVGPEYAAFPPASSLRAVRADVPNPAPLAPLRQADRGFWNSLPSDEERYPVNFAPERYKPHHSERFLGWIDVRELTSLLILTYSAAGCARLLILLIQIV